MANGSGLVLINITESVFSGRNTFNNNSINGSTVVLKESISTFEGYSEFAFNRAIGILSIHNYITLLDGATINISNNFNNVSANAALVSFTVESHFKFIPCYFQFSFF